MTLPAIEKEATFIITESRDLIEMYHNAFGPGSREGPSKCPSKDSFSGKIGLHNSLIQTGRQSVSEIMQIMQSR